jgi:hypothetical protein
LAHYRSLEPRLILQQIERGKLPKLALPSQKLPMAATTTKFKNLHRESASIVSCPRFDLPVSERPTNMMNFKVEPLSKYDEGAILFYE